ncbi:hypothetical protein ACH5RR_003582 [Cinchona calisaya]|uniref:Uncharacterized protein n=1 Tax=Cinchona calisaya TaxID=153742 RepID=A0ABD3AV90_9GENT
MGKKIGVAGMVGHRVDVEGERVAIREIGGSWTMGLIGKRRAVVEGLVRVRERKDKRSPKHLFQFSKVQQSGSGQKISKEE